MHSVLTRQVFRQILNNEPWSHAGWTLSQTCLQKPITRRTPCQRKRYLFGFSRKPPREAKPVDLDPGFEKMIDLSNLLAMRVRPPPPAQLAQAFNDFFRTRDKNPVPVEQIQVEHAMRTFQHLETSYTEAKDFGLTSEDLRMAMKALVHKPSDNRFEAHNKFARMLFEEVRARKDSGAQEGVEAFNQIFYRFIKVLVQSGDSLYARDLIEEYWHSHLDNYDHDSSRSHWKRVLQGFASEGNDEELLRTVDIMKGYGVSFDAQAHQAITIFYARKGDVEQTQKWYKHPIVGDKPPTSHTDAAVLQLCIQQNDLTWGQDIFKSLFTKDPRDKKTWNIILQWAAAMGKGVDEIERMMEVMVRRNEEKGSNVRPDIGTINALIELANSRNDPYTAERYVALGQKWNLALDAQTYLLQLEYRIKVGDISGAMLAYTRLQAEEVLDNKDYPLINKLIVALCSLQHQDYDAIMRLVEDLNERKARFEPETVSALALLHLRREELPDLVDLLRTHTFHYSLGQRAAIRDIFVDFCLDRSNSVARAWDAYCILREVFSETDTDIRTRLMGEFFSRRRSDMACHVFGHMRQQAISKRRPNISIYVACFEGIAKAADLQSLEMVHNMLKLDSEIEPDTKLHNALMLAYTACGEPDRSLGFWEDIIHSREGPTYNSIKIALRACEAQPFGDRQAREIWARLKKFEVEVTKEIYAAYIGALAGQALFEECAISVNEAEAEIGSPPDALM